MRVGTESSGLIGEEGLLTFELLDEPVGVYVQSWVNDGEEKVVEVTCIYHANHLDELLVVILQAYGMQMVDFLEDNGGHMDAEVSADPFSRRPSCQVRCMVIAPCALMASLCGALTYLFVTAPIYFLPAHLTLGRCDGAVNPPCYLHLTCFLLGPCCLFHCRNTFVFC